MNKLCPICKRKLIPINKSFCEICEKKHQKNSYQNRTKSKNESFYKLSKWNKLSIYIRNKYNNLDLYQLKVNNRIVKSKVVHHIIPVSDDPSRRYDENNLIPLSIETHLYIESIYKKGGKEKEELQKLLFSLLDE